MAFIGDLRNIMIYPEDLDNEPRHHVRRISCSDTILEDKDGTDEILDCARPLGEEDQEMLKWEPTTENWQNDFKVRDTLTNLSGGSCQELCPYNNIGLPSFGKETDYDTYQERIEPQSLSTYQHASLTIQSVSNEQVQLLFSRDGLPEGRSCLRWRSHDYIELVLSDAKLSCRVLWLEQWDVVDMTDYINNVLVATGPVTGLRINHSRPCLDPSTSERQSDDPEKFSGIRFRKKRKSPWSAEVKPKGSKNKISAHAALEPSGATPGDENHRQEPLRPAPLKAPENSEPLLAAPGANTVHETVHAQFSRSVPACHLAGPSLGNYFIPNSRLPLAASFADYSGKFSGVRFRKNRKSPWIAEVKPKGSKTKISVGCYQSRAAAARAVDAGRYYFNLNLDKLNFPDSVRFLEKIEVPPNLSEKALKAFVYKQAHRLANLAEKSPSTRISETPSCSTNTEGFTLRNILSANNFGAHSMTPGENSSFAGLPIATPDGFPTPLMDLGRDLQANLVEVKSSVLQVLGVLNRIQRNLNGCVRPSTSFGSGVLREPVAPSSQEENLLLSTSNNRFTTNSQVSAGDFHPELEPTYTHEASFAPVRNSSLEEATNDLFNMLDTAWDGNPEQDIPDDSARIRASHIPSVGVSDSNNLIHELESQLTNLTFPGYDFDPLGAGSEEVESIGDYGRDTDIFNWLDSVEEGC